MLIYDTATQRVECRNANIPYAVAVETLAHRLCAVLCEGHRPNPRGCEIVIVEEVLDTVG